MAFGRSQSTKDELFGLICNEQQFRNFGGVKDQRTVILPREVARHCVMMFESFRDQVKKEGDATTASIWLLISEEFVETWKKASEGGDCHVRLPRAIWALIDFQIESLFSDAPLPPSDDILKVTAIANAQFRLASQGGRDPINWR